MEKDIPTTGEGRHNSTEFARCKEVHADKPSGTKHNSGDNDIEDHETNRSGSDPPQEQSSSKKSKKKRKKKIMKPDAAACSASADSVRPTPLVTGVQLVQPGESIGYSAGTNDIVKEKVRVIHEYPSSGKLFPASDIVGKTSRFDRVSVTEGDEHAHRVGQTETTGHLSQASERISKAKESTRICRIGAIDRENEVKEVHLAIADESHDVTSTDCSDDSFKETHSPNLTEKNSREGTGYAGARVNDRRVQEDVTPATATTDIQRCSHVSLDSKDVGNQPFDTAYNEHLLKSASNSDKTEQDNDGNRSESHIEGTKMKNRSKKKKKRKRNKSKQNNADDKSVSDDSTTPKSVVDNEDGYAYPAETIAVASDELFDKNTAYLKTVKETNRDKSDKTSSVSNEQDNKIGEQNSQSSSTSFDQLESLPEFQLSVNLLSSAPESQPVVHANDTHKERVSVSTIGNDKVGYEASDGRKELKDHTNAGKTTDGQIPSMATTQGHTDQDSNIKKDVEINNEISDTESNTKKKKKRKKKKSKEALGNDKSGSDVCTNKDHVPVDDANIVATGETKQTKANAISGESDSVASQTSPCLKTSLSTNDDTCKSDLSKAVTNGKAHEVSDENDISLAASIRKQETTPESELCEYSDTIGLDTQRCAQAADRNDHDPVLSKSSNIGQKDQDQDHSVGDGSEAPTEVSQIKNNSKRKKKRKGQTSSEQCANDSSAPDGCNNQDHSVTKVTNGHADEVEVNANVNTSKLSKESNSDSTQVSTCASADIAEIGVKVGETKAATNQEVRETCQNNNPPSTISQQQQSPEVLANEQRGEAVTVSAAESYKLGAKISDLIEEAKKVQESGDTKKATQLTLQATIAASEAKDEFLKGEKKNLPPQPLADWFGTCALILHETHCCIPAIKCFYTATVFDGNWSIEDHVRVAETLWNSLLSRTEIVCKNTGRVYEVLNDVANVAELALRRCLYRLCSRVCDEINRVFTVLVGQYKVCRLERYHAAARPVFLCNARAHYHTGDFAVTRSICAAIVHEMSDHDCPEAFELWGLALLPEKEYELAVAKLRLALRYAMETGYQHRLRKMLEKVCEDHKIDIESNASMDLNNSSDTDFNTDYERSPKSEDRYVQTKSGAQRLCDRPRLGQRVDQTNDAGFEGTNYTHSPRNGSIQRPKHVSRNFYDESHSVESDDDDNITETHRQRISNSFTESQEVQEVTTFYERSRRFYEEADNSTEMADSTLQTMLEDGLQLNMSYLKQFEDKHVASYTRNPYYNEPKNEAELREKLKIRRTFLRCELQIESAHVAICKPLEPVRGVETIEIAGRSKAGQAFNGDEVVVQLIGKKHDEDGKRYGQVEGVLKRNRCKNVKNPVFLCTVDDMQSHLMRPICKTIPKISVLDKVIYHNFRKLRKYKVEIYNYDENTETLGDPEVIDIDVGNLQTYVFMVVYITWSRRQIYPRGAVIRKLECGENLTKGLMLLNLQHCVPSLYGRTVIEHIEANKLDQFNEIDPSDHPDRENLTKLPVFTIDPEGSKDLDDALNVVKVGNEYKVGVHIADVSEIVMLNDAVDEEARKRATTFYPSIPGKLPRNMLPEPLSAYACSLLPDKCRFALSVFFHLSADGELRSINTIDVRKTLIRSHEQFTYRQAQDIIEGKQHRLRQHIVLLHDLARKIRRRRLGNAMFAIDISGDDDDGDEGSVRETFEAHYLIEEFMIMANGAIARKLLTKFPDCTPLRCQPAPTEENVTKFMEENGELLDIVVKLQDRNLGKRTPHIGALLGTSAKVGNSSGVRIPAHIWKVIKSGSQDVSKLLCTDTLFPLQHLIQQQWIAIRRSAEYKCSGGENSINSLRHFELEKYPYTHFTSPIRRYVDLVVHRLLHAAIEKTACPYSKDDIQSICNHINSVTKNSKIYQKECKILKYAVELRKQPKMVFCYADQFSDRCISLASSAMQNVNNRNRELPFNLLDMGYKPELVEDPNASKCVLTATWKKRLYDLKGVSTNLSYKKKEIILNSNKGVVFIPLQRWARILKCVLEERFKDLKTVVESTEAVYSPSGNADDVSTESLHMVLQPNTTFSLSFRRGQMLKVQLSAVHNKGLLTPKPTLYNVTHNVKLCLQHTDDPVFYLSKYFNRCTCDRYNDEAHYLGRWIPLMQMEAATCAVANEESCVIDSVPLHFFHNLREGKFSVSTDFCENRNIEFSGIVSENDDGDESSEAYDWMCIRYLMSSQDSKQGRCSAKPTCKLDPVWVGHAEITGVKREKPEKSRKDEENGDTIVTFKLHERCPDLPTEARGKDSKFCVEILRKSEVDRRTESFLKRLRLPNYKSCLAHTIALNKTAIPKLDKLHLDMARTIERDIFIPPYLPKNNIRQQEAIDRAMNHRLSLIQGPPGTGKTYTGVKLMYLFDKVNQMISSETGGERRQILFCGPSNKSVDLVGNLLKEKLGNLCPKFVRVYGRSIESIEYPIPGRTFLSKKSTRALKADERLRSVSLHHLIREQGKQYAKEINAYDKMFKAKDYVVAMDEVKKYMKLLYDASVEELKHYGVILCTTAVGSNPKILGASSVYQVIVDEAGMCPEPQCLMPVIATKAEQVVLIGDHKQLRPIIICKQAAELGLETSLFEKLAMSNTAMSVQFTMLNWQYRMNPMLCSFPSKRFYDGELETKKAKGWTHDSLAYIWPSYNKRIYPHVLIPVEGEERSLTVATEEGNEHSKSNLAEVEVVIKILRYFVVEGVGGDSVNVISQYNAQCAVIRNRIKEEGLMNCNVSTVVSSQGGEWDYVIFSTVRSLPECKIERNPTKGWCQQNLGFITDQNQINVALTRAHKGLIIIGNENLLRCDEVFRALFSRYAEFGCIKKPGEFPPQRTRQQRMDAMNMLHWERYGEQRFIPGLGTATSFEGDVDNVPDDDDDDDGTGRRVFRRGRRKVLVNRQK